MTGAADMTKRQRRYLLREGHFLGLSVGFMLSHWPWVAVIWTSIVGVGWLFDLITAGDQ